jgi:hypothetical protein
MPLHFTEQDQLQCGNSKADAGLNDSECGPFATAARLGRAGSGGLFEHLKLCTDACSDYSEDIELELSCFQESRGLALEFIPKCSLPCIAMGAPHAKESLLCKSHEHDKPKCLHPQSSGCTKGYRN